MQCDGSGDGPSPATSRWKSQPEVRRKGSRYEEPAAHAALQAASRGSWSVGCGHAERTWLGRSQAMSQMNSRALVSPEHAVPVGRLFLLVELGAAMRS